jgi:hypothetical protein
MPKANPRETRGRKAMRLPEAGESLRKNTTLPKMLVRLPKDGWLVIRMAARKEIKQIERS